jgi:prolipoprotein diacylglyceryltransferase
MMNIGYVGIMLAAVGTGFGIARWTQRGLGLRPRERWGIGLGAFVGAMIGAKLPFVFEDWEAFRSGAAWFANGKTILTGLVGGYAGVEAAKWALDIRTRTGDSFVVPVAAAIGIGRLACFYAGCCYGIPTHLPWGVVFSRVDSLPRHPTQLYESLFHLGLAGLFAGLAARNLFPGQRIKLYLISYAAYRFASEWLRPEVQLVAGLTGYQIASALIAVLFAWLWWRDVRSATLGPAKSSADADLK